MAHEFTVSGRIAKPVGRPRMRQFVHREREQQHDERDEDLREVGSRQAVQVTFAL